MASKLLCLAAMRIWGCRAFLLLMLAFVVSGLLPSAQPLAQSQPQGICPETPLESHEQFLCQKKTIAPTQSFDREQILADEALLVSNDFKIDPRLKERVGFWFDIYTKYDSSQRVIHDEDYPWIIYRVVDTSAMMERPRARWLNQMEADKKAHRELSEVRQKMKELEKKFRRLSPAQIESGSHFSEEEKNWVAAVEKIPGAWKKKWARLKNEVRMQTGQKNFFVEGLKVSQKYLRTMERIFLELRLPTELARLPLVESSFNQKATSKVGAAGLWQFMPGVGKKFMLITDTIDERRSPFKSTEAAAVLLRENYMLFQRWPLALTAYNHGPAGVRRAMKKTGSRELGEIVGRYETKNFSFASQNFFCEFLAALYAQRYAAFVFGELHLLESPDYLPLELSTRLKPNQIFEWAEISQEEFLEFNPDLHKHVVRGLTLPYPLEVFLPSEKAFQFRLMERKFLLERKLSRPQKVAVRGKVAVK